MKHYFKRLQLHWIILTGIPLLMAFSWPSSPVTVFMAGDSTMSVKNRKAYPETGWGMPFVNFFDSTVRVANYARNGASTKTFINDNLWAAILNSMKPGDYVFIGFGHNDEVPTKASATTETEFKENLRRFVGDARSKKGTAVLVTSVARRKFDPMGKVVGTHDIYAAMVRQLADELNVPLIDMDRESQVLIQKYGREDSKILFNHLAPGENPNYPGGAADDTHLSELGARKMACIALSGIRTLNLELVNRIVIPPSVQKPSPSSHEKY